MPCMQSRLQIDIADLEIFLANGHFHIVPLNLLFVTIIQQA